MILLQENVGRNKHRQMENLYSCVCGAQVRARAPDVRRKHTTSCGCLKKKRLLANSLAMAKHLSCNTPTYKSYVAMKRRCLGEHEASARYKGRGIGICESWAASDGFIAFLADMGHRPPGTQLDRIDNDKGYFKENCRWVTPKQNARNRHNTIYLTWGCCHGTLTEFCEALNFSYRLAHKRFVKGCTPREIFARQE